MSEIGPRLAETLAVKAAQFGIPEPLLRAMALVESGGDLYATRFEPGYRYLWDLLAEAPLRLKPDERYPSAGFHVPTGHPTNAATEWTHQKTSWGPLQIMGAVAREYGFSGRFPQLCGELGVYYGAWHLANLKKRHLNQHGWAGVVAAYNAGSPRFTLDDVFVNQSYINKVAAHLGMPWGAL
jgi:soluble lytic murein transglycosylase-like protein